MRNFFYSRSMLIILAILLMTVFFLPDFIGSLPSLLIGAVVIGFSFFVYNKWCEPSDGKKENDGLKD